MNGMLRSWHRTMGVIIALFVLVLAATGILLNHTEDLELDQHYLTWPWLLDHYGLSDVEADVAYHLNDRFITQFDEKVFVDGSLVTTTHQQIIGGIGIDDITVLATDNELLLISPEGEFIEKMSASAGVPEQIQNIGLFHGEPVLQTRKGMWRSDYMLETWENISLQGVSWSIQSPVPDDIQKQLDSYFYGEGISVERFALDVHNGHILNGIGVWLLDIVAVLLIVLSISGLWMWRRLR